MFTIAWCLTISRNALAEDKSSAGPSSASPGKAADNNQDAILQVMRSIDWQKGPANAKLGDMATVKISAGQLFTSAEGTRKYLELNENVPSGKELGTILDAKTGWFAIFTFDDVGYVKDEEKSELDAAKLLKSLQEGNEEANEERKRRGWAPVHIIGWHLAPLYDQRTHNLVWATKLQSEDSTDSTINFQTRILGRHGVMKATLVDNASGITAARVEFSKVLDDFSYTPQESYSSFRSGDKVAEYGLTALILGGVAAAGAKAGLFKTLAKFAVAFWKLIVFGVIALGGVIKNLIWRPKEEAVEEDPPSSTGAAAG
jgi:uncharacterized membrane-anchored protein